MNKILRFVPKPYFDGDVDTNATGCWRRCQRTIINVENRTLKCKDCGRAIDPFDYLADGAKKQKDMWKNANDQLGVLYKEIGEKKDELAALKRQIRAVKKKTGLE